MPLKLKQVLAQTGRSQAYFARALSVSEATVAQIVNHGKWPKTVAVRRCTTPGALRAQRADGLQSQIIDLLIAEGVQESALFDVFDEEGEPCANTARPVSQIDPADVIENNQEETMLLRKQPLSQQAKKHFGLFRSPFSEEIDSSDDLFISPDIRYVREAMYQTAKLGGFLGVIGESGAGKTILTRDLEDRIERESQPIILIKPYVLAMEDNDQKGKTLKATHIAEAIMSSVAPKQGLQASPEARFSQLHRTLKASHTAGYKHCLLIDEAHSLPLPTIKHLKRFFELELGFKKLLSIILIGQPELRAKLDERNQQVREVVQRCELVELSPLAGQAFNDYLKQKFAKLSKPLSEVIDDSGIEAIRARLTFASRQGRQEVVSLLYPLAIGNVVTACMNLAAEVGAKVVTADVVKGV